MLHLTGYDVTIDDLKAFRQVGSKTPGHPEANHGTPGIEVTTGPLGFIPHPLYYYCFCILLYYFLLLLYYYFILFFFLILFIYCFIVLEIFFLFFI